MPRKNARPKARKAAMKKEAAAQTARARSWRDRQAEIFERDSHSGRAAILVAGALLQREEEAGHDF